MQRVTVTSPEELCALGEKKVLGRSLKPHRDVAMVAVGWRYVSVTGNPFKLTTGEQLPMPDGKTLPQPHGTDDWNARYSYYVAQHLSDRVKDEVDAYRLKPRNLLTWAGMGLVVEAMEREGWRFRLSSPYCFGDEGMGGEGPEWDAWFQVPMADDPTECNSLLSQSAEAADAPTVVLLAALRAKGVDVDYRPGEEG